MTHDYQVGDRVRAVTGNIYIALHDNPIELGSEGVIVAVHEGEVSYPIRVKYDCYPHALTCMLREVERV